MKSIQKTRAFFRGIQAGPESTGLGLMMASLAMAIDPQLATFEIREEEVAESFDHGLLLIARYVLALRSDGAPEAFVAGPQGASYGTPPNPTAAALVAELESFDG